MATIDRQIENLAHILRYVLGEAPDEYGLWPNEEGFVPLKETLWAIAAEEGFRGTTENRIREAVAQTKKTGSLEIVDNLIRVRPDLANLPKISPAPPLRPKIFHLGLRERFWPVVLDQGLKPKPGQTLSRLFTDKDQARVVAARASQNPVLIEINRALAEKEGTAFWKYTDRIYLATAIPPSALFGPPIKLKPEKPPADAPGLKNWSVPEVIRGKTPGQRDDSPAWKKQVRKERRKK
ncbi:MAG: RNA 2'-phosphotransferase [Deltaproteobacteria bacterium]|jgi:putative RNA 2'-phosphotransferase|nr:RNA 2'-phosphotransferase [Deltaproteobacteria bacterium]